MATLKRKLSSRKFLVSIFGAILIVLGKGLEFEVPWEAVGLLASYILGEGAVDMVNRMRR